MRYWLIYETEEEMTSYYYDIYLPQRKARAAQKASGEVGA
jgi:hypothetical protein